uniref:type IV secretory system conjugative DNA transfer family protein n=1 Tax=Hyphomicrobium sp. TaxID=82 RepID=UPI002FE34173
PNHANLDKCHVRIAYAPNDARTARRLSDALGTATELRAQTNLSGKRFAAWLSHTSVSEQETPRPLLTPGEVLQLPQDDALVFVSGVPPIRARKLRYYDDRNFLERCLPAPEVAGREKGDGPTRPHVWTDRIRSPDPRLDKAWADLVTSSGGDADAPPRTREIARRKTIKTERPIGDLPLFAAQLTEPTPEIGTAPADDSQNEIIQFPGLRL